MKRLYTLGHSRHGIAQFIDLARQHGITLIADVRGQPFSRYNPQFNREHFRNSLEAAGIAYQWFGDRLSGRPVEREFYGADGEVLWDKLRQWPELLDALDKLLFQAAHKTIALVCAEEDPMKCHRRFQLTPPLIDSGAEIIHIRGDGSIETEQDLARRTGNPQLDLFGPE
ncbi:MAG: DUF488 domain-containing protein [Rhodospirillales bacterium]|nr:DUF488 domain-containing protein [Rhodospirillales bacterium]